MRIFSFTILFLSCLALAVCAQNKASVETKKADDLFQFKNYRDALSEYTKLFKQNPKDNYISAQMGICYLNLNEDRSIAKDFLEPIVNSNSNTALNSFYYAKALTYSKNFAQALAQFNKAKELDKTNQLDMLNVVREIEMCQNAISLSAKPIKVSFENLGPTINSVYPDYSPFISANESFLIFNSRKEDDGVKMANGKFTSDVYISEVYLGDWMKAKNVGPVINDKSSDENIIGVSADGLTLIYNYENKSETSGDIFVGPKYDNEIMKPFKLNESINSTAVENSATISPDGKTLYFSSNRAGGFGGFDLYRALILPDGTWSEALNLGPAINTQYDEDFPNMSMDGNTIYFSSKGHNSMGGFDLFKINLDSATNSWSAPVNMGFPLNDAYDNINICMSATGRYGYLAAIKNDGFGDYDIYRVTFNSVETELTVIKGFLKSSISSNSVQLPNITITDMLTGNIFGEYVPNPKNNRYVIILPPGKFKLTASAKGFEEYSEYITVLGKSSFEKMVEKEILMKPLN
jgi:hypothetical protein